MVTRGFSLHYSTQFKKKCLLRVYSTIHLPIFIPNFIFSCLVSCLSSFFPVYKYFNFYTVHCNCLSVNTNASLWAPLAALALKNLPECRRQRYGFDPWVGKIPWRRAWQPTPVFLPGESHGQRSWQAPWGYKESGTTEAM